MIINSKDSIYEGDTIDLREVYISIKKGIKWLFIMPIFLVLISVIYLLFLAKPVYTSETKFMLSDSETSQSSIGNIASQFGISIPVLSDGNEYLSIGSISQILKSRKLAKSILYTDFESSDNDKLIKILIDNKIIDDSDTIRIIPKAIEYFIEKMVSIENIKNTSIFSLVVNSPEPKLLAELSIAIINELSKQDLNFKKNEQKVHRVFINERIVEVQNDLNSAEIKLKNFREENLQINLSPTLLLEQDRLEREVEVQTQIFISLKQQFEQIRIEEAKKTSILNIIDPPVIPIRPSKPKRKLVIASAFLFGVLIGSVIAVNNNYK